MSHSEITINLTTPFNLESTVLSHGWVNLPPFMWSTTDKALQRLEHLDEGDELVTICVKQKNAYSIKLQVDLENDTITELQQNEILHKMKRALNLGVDLRNAIDIACSIDTNIAHFLQQGGGRFLRGTTLLEDVIKTLFTTNSSWQFTQKMVNNLITVYGYKGGFPKLCNLLNVTENDLRERVRIGYRAKYLIPIIKMFVNLKEQEILSRSLPGLGPYGSSHLKMLNGDFSVIPIDSEVRSYCKEQLNINSDDGIKTYFGKWGEVAYLGYKLERQIKKTNWIG